MNTDDFDDETGNFRLEVPERFNFTRDVVDRWAEDPQLRALWWIDDHGNEQQWTFSQLARASRKVANGLTGLGIKRGDVVLVLLPRVIEWWLASLGCFRLGAVVSPGTIQLSAKDIAHRIEAAGAACVITIPELASRVEEAVEILGGSSPLKACIAAGGAWRPGWYGFADLLDGSEEFETADTESDEMALLYFTSGTTGGPKMTVHTHASYPLGHLITGKFWLDLTEHDVHWNITDTGWAKAGWSSIFGPWHMGATIFAHHEERFHVKRALEILEEYPITSVCAPPTMLRMFVLEDLSQYDFSPLRSVVTAGEPLNPETYESWEAAGSMGVAAPGYDLQVIDDDGSVLPAGREGDLAVRVKPDRPVGLFREYWKEPERTARFFKGDWYITGDRAVRDEDGYFHFVGRADDVILSAAYRIGPFEVESALLEHEAVAESAVVASPDPVRGSVVKAFVVLSPGFEPSVDLARQLQQFVKRTTAPYKYPRRVEFVTELPKTVSGKIRRAELRQREIDA
jgi:acetyl-CoA synthetase/medium-chain acyl-CoA synthetase